MARIGDSSANAGWDTCSAPSLANETFLQSEPGKSLSSDAGSDISESNQLSHLTKVTLEAEKLDVVADRGNSAAETGAARL